MPEKKSFDRDSISNTLTMAIGLSLICSVLVASAAIVLKPKQLRNQEEFRQRIILEVAGLMEPGGDIAALFAGIESENVVIANGESVEIYLAKDGNELQQIILPVEGKGLWSTMRGYLAVAPDGNTIMGFRFYEHAETPGLGDQVDRAEWRELWVGKQIYGDGDTPRIEVIKGFVQREGNPDAKYQIDGLSGATLTANGVTKLVRHWTGPEGFGPYLEGYR
ncbi:MAG: NADH:ubiquinone reductase (Na(+)-transporting) subunit C [Gammaproteobacteria bacterium]|nr:NADH:ubiquinone reductase (Na(+)-transporting) subunit C [Gammaproteobacteria bacterium]